MIDGLLRRAGRAGAVASQVLLVGAVGFAALAGVASVRLSLFTVPVLALTVAAVICVLRLSRDPRYGLALHAVAAPVVVSSLVRGLIGDREFHGAGIAVAVMAAAGVAARRCPPRWAAGLVAASFGWLGLALAFTDPPALFILITWMPTAALVVVASYFRFREELRTRMVLDARNHERFEIARELHDVVAHHVTGIVVQAQAGAYLATSDPERAARLFAEIEAAGREAMVSIRKVVEPLRSTREELPSMDVHGELRELVAAAERAGARVEVRLDEIPIDLGPTIVRLTREALANVRKHGRGVTLVTVDVVRRGPYLDWSVTNDGEIRAASAGEPLPAGRGLGLAGLRERAQALGGVFSAGPTAGGGWVTAARLPVTNGPDGPAGPAADAEMLR